ncbi:MAG: Ribosomal small subunit methyltransferase [Cyanobacteriota bacterium]
MVYRLVIAPTQRQGKIIHLQEDQRHYLQRVLRLRPGDDFIAMDGTGAAWQATLTATAAHLVRPLTEDNELPVAITLAVALPKGNGFEDILRPCTELGVTTFQPLITERTLLKPSPSKLPRWRRIVIEAAEQSERQWVPSIAVPTTWAELLGTVASQSALKLICVARHHSPLLGAYLNHVAQTHSYCDPIIVATGPEGGWTAAELHQAIASGFQPVSLGQRILRAITAPTVAVAQITAHYEVQRQPDNPVTTT